MDKLKPIADDGFLGPIRINTDPSQPMTAPYLGINSLAIRDTFAITTRLSMSKECSSWITMSAQYLSVLTEDAMSYCMFIWL